jgi:hypothetical protein
VSSALAFVLLLQVAPATGGSWLDAGQDPDRPPYSSAEIKALKESNLFSPYRSPSAPSRSSERRPETPRVETPAVPRPPVLTGIFFDAASGAWRAIVEDRNTSSLRRFTAPMFISSGDAVGDVTASSVEASHAVFLYEGEPRQVRVGESLPGPLGSAGTSTSGSGTSAPAVEIKPIDAETRDSVLEALKRRNKGKDRPEFVEE